MRVRRTKRLPPQLTIPEPCHEDWDGMRHDGTVRHCDRCQAAVVDVALLSAPQLHRLMERTGGHFCARLTHRSDGTLLLRETPATVVPLTSLLHAPVLAGALLASGAVPAAAQRETHAPAPVLSCAEVTSLRNPGAPDAAASLQAPAPAPAAAHSSAPAPPQEQAGAKAMGKVAVGAMPLHGAVRMPAGKRIRNGTVSAYTNHSFERSADIQPDGTYAVAVPRGTYWVRAEARGDDGQLYATVDTVTLSGAGSFSHDMKLQGPVLVTAGAPAPAPVQPGAARH